MDIKGLKGKTILIEDIETDSDGDITIIGRTPTEIKTIETSSGSHSFPIHQKIRISCIAHKHNYLECYFDEWEIDEEEENQ